MKRRAIVTTVPFGTIDRLPLERLEAAGIECVVNPLGRRLREEEIAGVIAGFPVVIAGTEAISRRVIVASPELRAICRVGIGLDSVDLVEARHRGIAVSYTPEAPSDAVAELTIGLILDVLRGIGRADRGLRAGNWQRIPGTRIGSATIGIIGTGRIGGRVARHLAGGFPGVRILAHDLAPDPALDALGVVWVDQERLLREADVVTLHVPLTPDTLGLIGAEEIALMKRDAALVNTARGGIVDEAALAAALRDARLRAAAVDVFRDEPYRGPLADIETIVLTCHMGSMTADCRARMEIEATEEAIRFLDGRPFLSPVPAEEYAIAERFALEATR